MRSASSVVMQEVVCHSGDAKPHLDGFHDKVCSQLAMQTDKPRKSPARAVCVQLSSYEGARRSSFGLADNPAISRRM